MGRLAFCCLVVLLSPLDAQFLDRLFVFSGIYGTPNIVPVQSKTATSKAECGMVCMQLGTCRSFSFQPGELGCRLYAKRIVAQDVVQPSLDAHFSMFWTSCPTWKGYVTVPGTNKCILVSNAPLTWSQAADTCGKDGGHLLIIENGDVMQKLQNFVPQDLYLVGFNDLVQEDHFLWLDGTPVNRSLFHLSEPSDDSSFVEDCGMLWVGDTSPGLHDDSCGFERQFLCSLPML